MKNNIASKTKVPDARSFNQNTKKRTGAGLTDRVRYVRRTTQQTNDLGKNVCVPEVHEYSSIVRRWQRLMNGNARTIEKMTQLTTMGRKQNPVTKNAGKSKEVSVVIVTRLECRVADTAQSKKKIILVKLRYGNTLRITALKERTKLRHPCLNQLKETLDSRQPK